LTPARIVIWALSLGAVIVIALILGGSESLQGKVGEAALLFVLFSLNSLSGLFLIERRPELTLLGAAAIGFSVAAYFVVLDTFFSNNFFPGQNSVWILVAIAFVLGQASMLLAFRRDEDSPLINAVLAGTLIVLALLIVLTIVSISGTDIGPKMYAILAVLYLLGALLPPCLRWAETEEA
jgi:peptidoglycan/LPS O-acetylase OafA/YrhL